MIAAVPELCYASVMEPAESILFFFGLFALVAEAWLVVARLKRARAQAGAGQ